MLNSRIFWVGMHEFYYSKIFCMLMLQIRYQQMCLLLRINKKGNGSLCWMKVKPCNIKDINGTITAQSIPFSSVCFERTYVVPPLVFINTNDRLPIGREKLLLTQVFLLYRHPYNSDTLYERCNH